jgi:hypothetical protein
MCVSAWYSIVAGKMAILTSPLEKKASLIEKRHYWSLTPSTLLWVSVVYIFPTKYNDIRLVDVNGSVLIDVIVAFKSLFLSHH